MGQQMLDGDRLVSRPNLEPGQIGRDRRRDVDNSFLRKLEDEARRERLADRAELEERFLVDRAPPSEVGPSRALKGEKTVSVGQGYGHPGEAAALEQALEPSSEFFQRIRHSGILGSHRRSGLSSFP